MKKVPEIVAVTDHGLVRLGLKHLLKEILPGYSILFLPSLQECLNGKCTPSFLLIESGLLPKPDSYSLERIRSKNKQIRILLIESSFINENIKTYVDSIVYANDTEESVLNKLKTFFANGKNQANPDPTDTLSEREKEIVELVALGKTNKEISDELFISPHTVITHRKNITAKLGIKTIAGLTVYAILNGIIDTDNV
jgi:DNA-binding NarL/FixJ family response regulator